MTCGILRVCCSETSEVSADRHGRATSEVFFGVRREKLYTCSEVP